MKASKAIADLSRELDGEKVLVVIGSVHQMMHDGKFYTASVVNAALGNGANLDVLIRVPAGAGPHVRIRAAIGGDGTYTLFDAPTTSATGSSVPARQRNRFSANVAATLIFSGPTVTGTGTALDSLSIPGGTGGGNSVGASISEFEEWILDPGDYLVRLTNNSGSAQPASLSLDWYEP